jgi:hypothetical protein
LVMAPHVDFAVWGPHQVRTLRKLKFSGLILSATGALHHAEVNGPATFDQWDACMQVFIAACIMLDICSVTGITRYRDHIRAYVSRYTEACWPLIYQADVRVRRELIVRVKRSLCAAGTITPATVRPWDVVFREVLKEYSFWKREVEDPALMILVPMIRSGAARSAHDTPGENPLARNEAEHLASSKDNFTGSLLQQEQHPRSPAAKKSRSDKYAHQGGAAQHNVTEGLFTTNRHGKGLCRDHQTGKCTKAKCDYSHQCARCLDARHGAHHPSECASTPTPPRNAKAGGKGKRGGKTK